MEAELAAAALPALTPSARQAYLAKVGAATDSRFRLFGADGTLLFDSWQATGPTYRLRNPSEQPWTKSIARTLVVEPATVRIHIASVVHKLGVASRQDAVALLGAESTGRADSSEEARVPFGTSPA